MTISHRKKIGLSILLAAVLIGGFFYVQKYNTYEYESFGIIPLPILKPAWERKLPTQQTLKLGLITDTQVRPTRVERSNEAEDAPRQLRPKQRAGLDAFVAQMKLFQPEANVFLGDIIEGTGDSQFIGETGLRLVKEIIDSAGAPTLWVVGNHEMRALTKEQYMATLGIDYVNKSFDYGDYRLILLDANYDFGTKESTSPDNNYIRGYIHPDALVWFEGELDTNKRVFVFMHHGAYDRNLQGDEGKNKQSIVNAADLRALMEEYNVEGFFNGHLEVRNYEEVRGIKYYSLTGTKKSKTYPGSFYELTIDSAQPDVTMYYTDVYGGSEYISVDFEDPATLLPLYAEEKEEEDKEEN